MPSGESAPPEPTPAAAAPEVASEAPTIEMGEDSADIDLPGEAAPRLEITGFAAETWSESDAPVPFEIPPAPGVPFDMSVPLGNGAPDVIVPGKLVPAAAAPSTPWAPSTWLLGITAFLVAAADIGSKEWAKHALAGPDLKRTAKHIEVIKDHMDFIFAQNPGGAWSFLRSVPDSLRRPFFLFVSSAAIVFIVTVYQRLERRQWAMRWGLPLALGGAIGNLADRMRYGWVVDFVDIYYRKGTNELHWPTFNVADIAIVVGVGLMAIDLLSLRRAKTPAAPAPEAAGGAA